MTITTGLPSGPSIGGYAGAYCNGLDLSAILAKITPKGQVELEQTTGFGATEGETIYNSYSPGLPDEELMVEGWTGSSTSALLADAIRNTQGLDLNWTVFPTSRRNGALGFGWQMLNAQVTMPSEPGKMARFTQEGKSKTGLDLLLLIDEPSLKTGGGEGTPFDTGSDADPPGLVMYVQVLSANGTLTVKTQHKNSGEAWADLVSVSCTAGAAGYRTPTSTAAKRWLKPVWTFGTATSATFLVAVSQGTSVEPNIRVGTWIGFFGPMGYGQDITY